MSNCVQCGTEIKPTGLRYNMPRVNLDITSEEQEKMPLCRCCWMNESRKQRADIPVITKRVDL